MVISPRFSGLGRYKRRFLARNQYVTYLKVRGSYGVTGNDNAGGFAYESSIASGRNYTFGGNDIYTFGNSPNAIANPDLKWEQTAQTDIGFDASIYKDFTLTFDWFNKKTSGILATIAVPLYVGVNGPEGNIGTMSNKGYEIELGYHKTIGGVFVDVKGNASHIKNRVTRITQTQDSYGLAKLQSSLLELSRVQVRTCLRSFLRV